MSIEEKIKTAKEDSWLKDSVSEKEFKEIKDNERRMKIVIDIPKEEYLKLIKTDENGEKEIPLSLLMSLWDCVKYKCTPLPKNHGRLIDTNDLEDFCQTHKVGISAFDGELIYDAGSTSRGDTIWKPLFGELKPIIEAESGEEE